MDRFPPKAATGFRLFLIYSLSALGFFASAAAAAAGAGAGAGSAGDLSLERALDEATGHSPALKRAESAASEASSRRLESYSGFLPTLNASANYLFDKRYMFTDVALAPNPTPLSIPNVVPTSLFTLDARWTLYDGLSNFNRLRAAKSLESAAREDSNHARFMTSRQVTLAFFSALGAETLKAVATQNLKTIEDHQKDANLLRKAGVSTKFDVLRVDVQVSEAKTELLNADDAAETAKGRLAEAIGAETETRTLFGALPEPDPDWIKELAQKEQFNVADRADLHATAGRVEALNYQKAAVSSHWSPRIGLFGTYQYYNNRNGDFSDFDNYRTAYQVGVALAWNLFDGLADVAKERAAVEQRVQAEAGLRAATLHAKQDFDYWHKRFLYYCSVFRSRAGDVDKSNESVRLAKEGRRAGTRTNTELLDAELELFRARAGVVTSQMGAVEALVNLEIATGRALHPFH